MATTRSATSVFCEQGQSRLENVQVIWDRVAGHLSSYYGECMDEHLDGIRLAFTEGLVNAIEHAHKEDGRPVHIELELLSARCEIRIIDTGPGFVLSAPVTDPFEDFEAESGRGEFLMRSMMDSVSYEPCKDGNMLTLKKSIPTSKFLKQENTR